jgi:hypothetical protein
MLKRQNSLDPQFYDVQTAPARAQRPRPRAAQADDLPEESPARRLQQQLDMAWNNEPDHWSARRTLAFSTLVCGAFWLGAALAFRAIF